MKKIAVLIASIFCLISLLVTKAFAHPGGTDSRGGHTNHSTGEYHYHHGYSAHDHRDMDGDGTLDCPYEFNDKEDHLAIEQTTTPKESMVVPNIKELPNGPVITDNVESITSPKDKIKEVVSFVLLSAFALLVWFVFSFFLFTIIFNNIICRIFNFCQDNAIIYFNLLYGLIFVIGSLYIVYQIRQFF